MDAFSIAGLHGPSLFAAVILVVCSLVVGGLSLWPDRQFLDWPRGVFPAPEHRPRVGHYRSSRPPIRGEKPQMMPAEAAMIVRDAAPADMTVSCIVDLASRGFLRIVEYEDLAFSHNSFLVSYVREADDTCTDIERGILDLFSHPGAAEAEGFVIKRPFDSVRFRVQTQQVGMAIHGVPTARLSGIRRSLSKRIGHAVVQRCVYSRGWFMPWKTRVSSLGALILLGGIAMAFLSLVSRIVFDTATGWIVVWAIVAAAGSLSLVGTEGRTAKGSVAYDQAVGYRRFLSEAPAATSAGEVARSAGWALALGCVDEWVASLQRLGANPREVFPWFASLRCELSTWQDVTDVCETIAARLHSDESSDDAEDPLPENASYWGGVASRWA